MKVAVIGAGNWGKNLVRNLHDMNALAGVAEANPALRDSLARAHPDLPLYDDHAALLETDVPAVLVATPAQTHHTIARDVLEAGKDVYVEKPFTLSVRDAEALAALARERDRILMVGHLLLYQPAIAWMRDYLRSGSLGKVYSLHQERLNLGQVRSFENVLWSLGVHDIAAHLHLVGETPVSILIGGQQALQAGIEDDVYLHLSFKEGIQSHMHFSWLWPEKRRRLTVVGSDGMLEYDEAAQTVTLHRKGIRRDLQKWEDGREVLFTGSQEPLRLELEHFLHCVETRSQPLSDGQNGADVVRILEEATGLLGGK